MKNELDTLDDIRENEYFNELIKSDDTLRFFHLYCLGRDFGKSRPDLSFEIADSIIKQSIRDNYPRGIISGYNLNGILYTYNDDYVMAVENLKKAKDTGEKYLYDSDIHIKDKYACTLYYLGDLYYKKGDYGTALDYYRESFSVFNQFTKKNIEIEDSVFAEFGKAFTTIMEDKTYSVYSVGRSYLALNELDSAEYYLNESIEILNEYPHERQRARTYHSLSNLYLKQNQLDTARYYMINSLNISEYLGLYEFAIYNYINLVKFYSDSLDEFYRVEGYYCRALELCDIMDMKKEEAEIHRIYSEFLFNLGRDREAYKVLNTASMLKNKIYDKEAERRFGQLEAGIKYQKELNELEMKSFKAEQEEKRLRTRLFFTFAIILLLIIIAGVIFYTYRKNIEQNKELSRLNEELGISNAQLEDLNQTKNRLFKIISHDLKNPIAEFNKGTTYLLESYKKSIDDIPEQITDLNKSANNINGLLVSLLNWADSQFKNNRVIIDEVDLSYSIEMTILLYENLINEKKIEISYPKEPIYIKSDRNICDTIIRNVLHNSIKYSHQNGEISIKSFTEDGYRILEITDTGSGIPKDELERIQNRKPPNITDSLKHSNGSGFGLLTVIDYIDRINGNIFIESEEGRGTKVTVYFQENIPN